jgi:competence protein CoiA-like protein
MVDLLVVGLDLVTGQEVHAGDREVWQWYRKGHNGDQTLVCKQCYDGDGLPGPRLVALVPKGRRGGRRRPHFAHPSGQAPPGGRHSRETAWHAEGKQRMRRWAASQGAAAQVEAYTPDGRRRSDVAITVPGGGRVVIEVQLGEVSDTEWLTRHEDYVRAGITDVWLWHAATWVPRVMFASGQPGWILDLDGDRIGLIHARPAATVAVQASGPRQCDSVHWPPCPEDQLDVLWMPLASARLTTDGIRPSDEATAELARQHEAATAPAQPAATNLAPPAGSKMSPRQSPASLPITHASPGSTRQAAQLPHAHYAFRYDAFPPWTDPDTWWYHCDACGGRLTGAEINASTVTHIVPTPGRRTSTGQPLISYTRYGGPAPQADERPAAPWAYESPSG